jgi:hypothetical protein
MTLANIKALVRADLSELESKKITDALLLVYVNQSQRRVQLDLMNLGLNKIFTKYASSSFAADATLTWLHSASAPTDLLSVPNALISVRGTANGKPYTETTAEDYARESNNNYLSATSTEPRWFLAKDSSGTLKIWANGLSGTVNYNCWYYYKVADLASDSDSSGIPDEYEKLLIDDIKLRVYETLMKSAEMAMKAEEYKSKVAEITQGYQNFLKGISAEKERLTTN